MTADHDLVTVALLGTDRRPLPAQAVLSAGSPPSAPAIQAPDPASTLLDRAVREQTRRRTGSLLESTPPGPTPPVDPTPLAIAPAQDLLGQLLDPPQVELVGIWLQTSVTHGVGPAPEFWPGLAALAVRDTRVDRPTLLRVLGPRGAWFLQQHPTWSRLVAPAAEPVPSSRRSMTTARLPPSIETQSLPPGTPRRPTEPEDLARDPELIFAVPKPWPRPLLLAALALVGTGQLQRRNTAYAVAVAARAPLELVVELTALVEDAERPVPVVGAASAARSGLHAWQQTASALADIDRAFRLDPSIPPALSKESRDYT